MTTRIPKGMSRFALLAMAIAATSLASAAEPAGAPITAPPLWTGSASLGLTLTSGNSDTLLFTAKIVAARKWDHNEFEFGADAAYGEQDHIKNNEAYHGYAQFNHLFTERFYGYLRLDALHDGIADIAYRVNFGPGAGYYFIKNAFTMLRGEVGPGVVFERKGDESKTYATLRVAERWEQKLTKTANLWESVEFLPQVDRWGNYAINSELGIDVAINAHWSLKPYVQDNYVNEPAPGRKSNDFKLVVALGYKF